MTFRNVVAALFDREAAAAHLADLCSDQIEMVADGVRFAGVDGVQRWLDASRETRFAVYEVAGEAGETASAIVGAFDGSDSERRELVQLRFDQDGRLAHVSMRPAGTPVRTVALLSAKPGLRRDELRDYYENHHVPLIRSLAPVPLSYTRTYLPNADDRHFPADFDVVTQLRFADAEAQAQWLGLVTADGSGVAEDEARFLDRSLTRSWVVRVEGDSDGRRTMS